jgi:hypothetical protein
MEGRAAWHGGAMGMGTEAPVFPVHLWAAKIVPSAASQGRAALVLRWFLCAVVLQAQGFLDRIGDVDLQEVLLEGIFTVTVFLLPLSPAAGDGFDFLVCQHGR